MTIVASGTGARAALLTTARELDARLVVMQSGSLLDLAWKTIEQRLMIRFVLFGVSPHDPRTLAAATLLMAASIAGAISPAMRAGRVDAADLLRHE